MKKSRFLKPFSVLTALVITALSLTFMTPQKASAVTQNGSIEYICYDYTTKKTTTYTLSKLPMASGTARDRYPENRLPDPDYSVVYLSMNNGNSSGSGFIVGAHCIATAAHCVTSGNGFVNNITATMCSSKAQDATQTVNAVRVHIPKIYRTSTNPYEKNAYDYALIYVEEDLTPYGIFDLGVATDTFLKNEGQVVASGFPGRTHEDTTGVDNSSHQRYYSLGKMQTVHNAADLTGYNNTKNQRFQATCIASGGDSGGPVYAITYLDGKRYDTVVGIITGGGLNGTTEDGKKSYFGTYGVRITLDLLHFYKNNDYI